MNILLIDNDIKILTSLSEFLRKMQHNTFRLRNHNIHSLPVKISEIQFVILDITSPSESFELMFKLNNNPDFKGLIVLMTENATIKEAIKAMKEGAYDYISKPLDFNEIFVLTQKIEELLMLRSKNENLNSEKIQLLNENETLKKEFTRIVGMDESNVYNQKVKNLIGVAEKFHSHPEIPILIEGETGVGKEVLARFIHYGKEVSPTPFIALNCATLSHDLFETELFGVEQGTQNVYDKNGSIGKIELAKNGSLLLDDVSVLSCETQSKLLRLIQEKEFYRVGGTKPIKTNTRIICTTKDDISELISEKKFHRDLYYRFQTGHLRIPPLRERKDEILPLAKTFLKRFKKDNNSKFSKINEDAEQLLISHSWEGNIRELKNTIERILILFEAEEITASHISQTLLPENINLKDSKNYFSSVKFSLKSEIINIVKAALDKYDGNKSQTAKFLGISRTELYTYLKKIKQ